MLFAPVLAFHKDEWGQSADVILAVVRPGDHRRLDGFSFRVHDPSLKQKRIARLNGQPRPAAVVAIAQLEFEIELLERLDFRLGDIESAVQSADEFAPAVFGRADLDRHGVAYHAEPLAGAKAAVEEVEGHANRVPAGGQRNPEAPGVNAKPVIFSNASLSVRR